MSATLEPTLIDSPSGKLLRSAAALASEPAAARTACFHCGEPCRDDAFTKADKRFCCQGCLVVHDLLSESGLGQFYELSQHPGAQVKQAARREQWLYLDDPVLQQRLLDFTDGKLSRVTFQIPAIHCVACVWLLENLFRLQAGIGKSQVNFSRREVLINYATEQIALSELVALLASIGYAPQLTLGELDKRQVHSERKRQWLQVGIAGFAFGNIMLFSIPGYFGLDSLSGPLFKTVFGYLSLLLAAPVVVYSASDYWRSALLSARQRILTLDVPIALGLVALYAQSAFEIVSGRGEGYLDSLAGLIFFLLCGRVFQQKTHDRMAFDRDYRCFFPLSVVRRTGSAEENVALSNLRVGDRLVLRHGELIPADGRLVSGPALIDYSFVTGESEPVAKQTGDYLYAGGQQIGGRIEVETVKAVSQSYLTSLWNHEAFSKERDDNLNTLTNRYSRRFTRIVLAVAIGAALFWLARGENARALKAFTSVLIVACPCALALAAPFTLGSAQRILARGQVFLKNALVLERLAQVDTIVFDKTGTLTAARNQPIYFHPPPSHSGTAGALSSAEAGWVGALARHSTHPHAARIAAGLTSEPPAERVVEDYEETAGCGLESVIEGHAVRLGSKAWLAQSRIVVPEQALPAGSVVALAIDGRFRGAFVLANPLRPETERMLTELSGRYELALLSGDNERERERFKALFGNQSGLHFNQSPLDKLGFIRSLQESGKRVMMVGDGLNDAGALKVSDVGVTVIEQASAFSPASDIILSATQVPRLGAILELARRSTRLVRWGFGISGLYNLAGISIASAGVLSPLICAILMPLSSLTVVLFSCGMAKRAAHQAGLKP